MILLDILKVKKKKKHWQSECCRKGVDNEYCLNV